MNLFDLMAKISLDTTEYDEGLDSSEKKGKRFAQTLGSGMKAAAKVGGIAIGAVSSAIGVLAKKSVSAYADYEQLSGGVEKLFGRDAAKQMLQYANEAYRTAGMSANQFMEQSTSFAAALINSYEGDTMKAADQANKAMMAISDNFNTFGGDIASVQSAYQGFAKQNYTMLDNLKLGYGGTKTEMERLIKDANEYAKANGMAADLSIQNFGDIVEAIDLIQQKQGIAGTTAKEAATTISGSVGMMKAAWQNLFMAFSDKDADLGKYINTLVTSAETAFNNIFPVVEQAINGIGQFITAIVPMVAEKLPGIISSVLPGLVTAGASLLTAIISGLIQALPSLIAAIPDIIGALVDGLAESGPAILEAGSQLMQMLGDGLKLAGNFVVDAAHTVWTDVLGGSEESWEQISTATSEAWNGIKDSLSSIWGSVKEYASFLWNGLKDFFSENGSAIGESIAGAWTTISGKLSTAWSALSNLATSIFTGLKNFWSTWGGTIITILGGVWDTITSAFSGALDVLTALFGAFSSLFQGDWRGFWDGILATGTAIWNAISSTLSSLWDGIKATGAAIWEAIGADVSAAWESIKAATSSMWEAIKTAVADVWDGIKSSVSAAVESVESTVSGVWESMKSTASEVWNGIKSTISDTVNSISETVSSSFNAVLSAATGVWNSIKNAISDAINGAKDIVSEAIEGIKGLFDFSWSLPHISLPHFSLGTGISVLGITLPSINVDWYKKAYETPYLFDKPTVVGNMGFGDGNGAEIVYGHTQLMNDIKNAFRETNMDMMNFKLYLDGDKLVGGTSDRMDSSLGEMQQYQLRWEGA